MGSHCTGSQEHDKFSRETTGETVVEDSPPDGVRDGDDTEDKGDEENAHEEGVGA